MVQFPMAHDQPHAISYGLQGAALATGIVSDSAHGDGFEQKNEDPKYVQVGEGSINPQDAEDRCTERSKTERHHKWINRQITCAAATGNIPWLLQVVHAHLDGMNLINFSTALHRIAKLALGCNSHMRDRVLEQESIHQLQQAVIKHFAKLDFSADASTNAASRAPENAPTNERMSEMRCLSIICWSCATLRIREESLFNRVSQVSSARFAELKPFELSNMLWAFAKLSLGQSAFFDGIAPCLMARRPGQFSPQCLSTIVWAFGTAKVHHAAIFTSFASEIAAKAPTMTPQGIANTAWAFARVRRQEAPLFRELAEAAIRDSLIWTFKAQELSNTVWAFATVGLPHPQLFSCIAEVTESRRFELPPQNVANMLWAYAKLMAAARRHLFQALLGVAICRLEQYKPQEVSAMLWAAAKEVGCPVCRRFFLAVPQYFAHKLPEFTSQALACMVEAFTLADVDSTEFFDAMVQESIRRLRSFQPPSLCTFFRGVALNAIRKNQDTSLAEKLRVIGDHVSQRVSEMQPHNFTHLNQTMDLLPASLKPPSLAALLSTRPITVTALKDSYHGETVVDGVHSDALNGHSRQGRRRANKRRNGGGQIGTRISLAAFQDPTASSNSRPQSTSSQDVDQCEHDGLEMCLEDEDSPSDWMSAPPTCAQKYNDAKHHKFPPVNDFADVDCGSHLAPSVDEVQQAFAQGEHCRDGGTISNYSRPKYGVESAEQWLGVPDTIEPGAFHDSWAPPPMVALAQSLDIFGAEPAQIRPPPGLVPGSFFSQEQGLMYCPQGAGAKANDPAYLYPNAYPGGSGDRLTITHYRGPRMSV